MILTFKFAIYSAEGRTRTDTGVAPQQFLRLPRLPFRHFGALTSETLIPIQHPRGLSRYSATNLVMFYNLIVGAEERSRTADTRIFSPLLYHLSYLGVSDIVGFLLS
jgi:hypothetical protein